MQGYTKVHTFTFEKKTSFDIFHHRILEWNGRSDYLDDCMGQENIRIK